MVVQPLANRLGAAQITRAQLIQQPPVSGGQSIALADGGLPCGGEDQMQLVVEAECL